MNNTNIHAKRVDEQLFEKQYQIIEAYYSQIINSNNSEEMAALKNLLKQSLQGLSKKGENN